MGENKPDVLQGTLDLMVLKTLESMGPLHGYGIARRIEQVSGNALSRPGRKQIEKETENWERVTATMARFLAPSN